MRANVEVECSSGIEVTWAHAAYTGDRHDNKRMPLVQFDDSKCSVEVHQGPTCDLQQVIVAGLLLSLALAVEGIRKGQRFIKGHYNRVNGQIAAQVATHARWAWALGFTGPAARGLCDAYYFPCIEHRDPNTCAGAVWSCDVAAIRTRAEGGDGNPWLDKTN